MGVVLPGFCLDWSANLALEPMMEKPIRKSIVSTGQSIR